MSSLLLPEAYQNIGLQIAGAINDLSRSLPPFEIGSPQYEAIRRLHELATDLMLPPAKNAPEVC